MPNHWEKILSSASVTGRNAATSARIREKIVIEPQYDHAWIFSEGIASVEENGYIKFINGSGDTVFDLRMPYIPNMDGYVFHGGYCVILGDGLDIFGLIDKNGKTVIPCEYNSIKPTNDGAMWRITKGKGNGLLDKDLNPIVPLTECSMWICDGMVDMTMPDHTMRKYDLKGNLINDFYIVNVRMLEYEKDEIIYRDNVVNKVDDEITEILEETYHPKATARMRAYIAGDCYEGLISADGHIITMPLYKNIEALGYDLYICEVSNSDKVIINGKGEIVR